MIFLAIVAFIIVCLLLDTLQEYGNDPEFNCRFNAFVDRLFEKPGDRS